MGQVTLSSGDLLHHFFEPDNDLILSVLGYEEFNVNNKLQVVGIPFICEKDPGFHSWGMFPSQITTVMAWGAVL